nr:hypothetical protein [Tanacetum cinerariifolium]
MYLHKVKECDYLAQKLSKQTESVNKKVHTELLQRFAKVEKHLISLELALKKCKEQVKNDTVCNEKDSNVFQKEREQYFEIQDLKAQLQDKNITISDLKKLIEKGKGKSVDTKFDRPSVVRQPNTQRIPKPSVLGKPTPFLDSLKRKYFPKTKSVPKANVSEGLSKPVTTQTLPQTAKKVTSVSNEGPLTYASQRHHQGSRRLLKDVLVSWDGYQLDMKARLQDKGIVISVLKKLIEKLKGKSVDTKFEKSSVIRQSNAFKSQRPSVLGKLTTFSNSFVRKDFSKSTSVTQTHVSNDFSKPVTAQTLPSNKKTILKNTNVLAPGMYKIHTDHNQTRTSQLPQDSRKTNKRVSFSTGVILTTSVSRPPLKSNPIGDRVMCNSSQGKKQKVEDQCRSVKLSKNKMSVTACNDSLKAKTLNVNSVCATCDKCVLHDKHDMRVLNSVAKPIKRTVAFESNQKPRNFTRKLYERVSKTCSW